MKGKAERERAQRWRRSELQECLRIQGKYSLEKMVHVREGKHEKAGKEGLDLANRMSLTAVETVLPLGLEHTNL